VVKSSREVVDFYRGWGSGYGQVDGVVISVGVPANGKNAGRCFLRGPSSVPAGELGAALREEWGFQRGKKP
jgi:hypothetical protein